MNQPDERFFWIDLQIDIQLFGELFQSFNGYLGY